MTVSDSKSSSVQKARERKETGTKGEESALDHIMKPKS